jgi:ubiquinone/menaquinone biosynthesis C-methylase UbiE
MTFLDDPELMSPLELESAACCICGGTDGDPVGVGQDFEYRTSNDSFLAVRCPYCTLVYLDPRPAPSELGRIYPDDYHAFEFSAEQYGLVHAVRSRLEARRILKVLGELPSGARILDVGCGDGFHLDLLRTHGPSDWVLEGVDLDKRAVAAGSSRDLTIHHGTVEALDLPAGSFDAALMIQTIEHVGHPPGVLAATKRLLKPGGRLMIVTDNTGSPDFRMSCRRYWGGYHFPRHWNLFNERSIRLLAAKTGFEVASFETIVSPVNWTYSVRNALDDVGAPRWLVNQFSLSTPVTLGVFTAFDAVHTALRRGALLRVVMKKPL